MVFKNPERGGEEMKNRPTGFLSQSEIDHNGTIYNYIQELHGYLWRVIRAIDPLASGKLSDYLDDAIAKLEEFKISET